MDLVAALLAEAGEESVTEDTEREDTEEEREDEEEENEARTPEVNPIDAEGLRTCARSLRGPQKGPAEAPVPVATAATSSAAAAQRPPAVSPVSRGKQKNHRLRDSIRRDFTAIAAIHREG